MRFLVFLRGLLLLCLVSCTLPQQERILTNRTGELAAAFSVGYMNQEHETDDGVDGTAKTESDTQEFALEISGGYFLLGADQSPVLPEIGGLLNLSYATQDYKHGNEYTDLSARIGPAVTVNFPVGETNFVPFVQIAGGGLFGISETDYASGSDSEADRFGGFFQITPGLRLFISDSASFNMGLKVGYDWYETDYEHDSYDHDTERMRVMFDIGISIYL